MFFERNNKLTPDEFAAVEKLTAELYEFSAIVGRITADLAELERVDPQAYASLIEAMNSTGASA
jgi:ABC-type transporter Mla MlaB component